MFFRIKFFRIILRQSKYQKNRRELDMNYISAQNSKTRTDQAFRTQNVRKTIKTSIYLGLIDNFFQK